MEAERQCFLPGKFCGESVGMGAGITPRATGDSLDPQLLANGEVKELIKMILNELNEAGVYTVVGDLKKAMVQARSPNELGSILGCYIVTLEETLEINQLFIELFVSRH